MAKIQKKGKAGQAKNFITRTQAVRKLQISLQDFRRLCIFKGIYPREPRNKKKVSKGATSSTTFYYTKDIQYLLHEPLLARFRDHKALSKKIARSLGKGEYGDAARLDKKDSARLSLDHIVKERYPTFIDALRDLDDALSLLFLFANLPSTANIEAKKIHLCQRLCHEFQHYIILSHSLRKSFLSIKGIYYQATIQGQDIMWLVPYRFVQRVTSDVDLRIMGTFVEFYTTLLGFVNYRLFSTLGLVYPPRFNTKSDQRGAELGAFTIEGLNLNTDEVVQQNGSNVIPKSLTNVSRKEITAIDTDAALQEAISAQEHAEAEETAATIIVDGTEIDKFVPVGEGADVLAQPQVSSFNADKLFADMHIFISRESPRQPLEFILKSFGCKRVSWPEILGDGAFTYDETDGTITHQIVDRPSAAMTNGAENGRPDKVRPGHIVLGRNYVQPQWIWDCVNANELQRLDLYAPGTILPPHLSPWVKPKKGVYDPSLPLAEQEPEGEAEDAADAAAALPPFATDQADEDEADDSGEDYEEIDEHGMQVADDDEHDDSDDMEEKDRDDEVENSDDVELNMDAVESEEDEDEGARRYREELAAEIDKKDIPSAQTDESRAKAAARRERDRTKRQKAEELKRRKGLASNRKRKAYERMEFGNQQRNDEAAALRGKRRELEQSKRRKIEQKKDL